MMNLLELAKQYAALKGAAILAHRIDGKAIIFVLSTGPKLTMTEAELKAALPKTDAVGTVAGGVPPASDESASRAQKKKKEQ